MSSRRLWVRISNCSRLFLSTWGERFTVNFSILVGSGMGPRTCAPVRFAVFTISRVDASRMRRSNALSRMRIFCPFIVCRLSVRMSDVRDRMSEILRPPTSDIRPLFDDLRDDAAADGAAALADRKAKLLPHRNRHEP